MVAPLRVVDRLGDRIHQIASVSLRRARPGRSPQRCQVVIERVIRHAGSIPAARRLPNGLSTAITARRRGWLKTVAAGA